MHYGINDLWPTSVMVEKIKDNNLLERLVQEITTTIDFDNPPPDFQQYDILNDGGQVFEEFKKSVVIPAFDQYLKQVNNLSLTDFDFNIRSWITGTGYSYMIPVHNHSGASLSAVFYLLCEQQNHGGELFLIDPRSNANRGYLDKLKEQFAAKTFKPKTGEFIVMPSFLYHQTLTFTGSLRLAMPVDLYLIE